MASRQEEDEPAARPNRVLMPGMIWNANHVLHLAMKEQTQNIPSNYFQDCEGILLLNIVELGLLVSGAYGTGILLSKQRNNGGATTSWSPPCGMVMKSLGLGSFGTAVRDLIIFIFDRPSLENLTKEQGLNMENPGRATLGPLGRHETATPKVNSEAIGNYAAYAYTKGAFAGITGDYARVYPLESANQSFYKTKKKQPDIKPEDILFGGSVVVPKKVDTLLPEVYAKLDALSKGAVNEGKVPANRNVAPAEQALPSAPLKMSSTSTKSSQSSNPASSGKKPHPGVAKQPSKTSSVGTKPRQTGTPTQNPRPTSTKAPSARNGPVKVKSVRPKASKAKPVEADQEYDC